MGIFDFFKNQFKKRSIFVSRSEFERSLKEDNYVPLNKHPDVTIAVDKIADLVSNMTIQLWENTEKGDVRLKNALSRKIDVEPCKNMTRKSWIFRIVKDLLLYGNGNAVVYIDFDFNTGLIKDLVPFSMQELDFDITDDTYLIKYRNKQYSPEEVIHFVINPDKTYPFLGTGYQEQLRDIVYNLSQATKIKRSFMSGKNMPSLVVKVDANNEELASEEGRNKIFESYLQTSNANIPWIIPADMMDVVTVKPLTLNDIAINESVVIDKKTVASLIGVPSFILGVGEFKKEEYLNFIDTKIMGIAQIIAQTLTRDLLISDKMYFKFNQRSLYAYNLSELVTAGVQLLQANALRRNELRDWIGMPPDEEMEQLIALENYIPQSELANQNKLKGGDISE